jgi:hypothetical protein
MRRIVTAILTAILALCAGCGGTYPTGKIYAPPAGQTQPALPAGVATSAPLYLIDDSFGINVPYGAYGITTSGVTWFIEWRSEDAHTFSGDVYCPAGCLLQNISFSADRSIPGYSLLSPNQLHFDGKSTPGVRQHLQFDITKQPIGFSLFIDGMPASNPYTVFRSDGKFAATDAMPFALISGNVTPGML